MTTAAHELEVRLQNRVRWIFLFPRNDCLKDTRPYEILLRIGQSKVYLNLRSPTLRGKRFPSLSRRAIPNNAKKS